ncbi:hypothetical protein CCR85_13620 [Rhodothalassium salexigens]|uniref:sensor histidine kinase n=1 Tax=Rhodothalassium salexigens TaxID=1086 RepID=UPI00191374BE|nr:sensor histidine kinase [Rhodothalassium salexigens]MBK5912526.1 hypothetical protein [Rhodothalassium salexigens]MBK5919681.1 hypothetical protein [Rhodothalassium salexigens]
MRPAILQPGSLTLRLVAVAGVWVVAALTAGGAILSLAFRDYAVRDAEALLTQTLETLIGVTEHGGPGPLSFSRALGDERFREPYSGYYWQIARPDAAPAVSRSLWDVRLDPDWDRPAARGAYRLLDGPDGQRLKAAVRDVTLPGSPETLRFMVATDIAEVEADIDRFNALILRALGLLGVGLLAAVGLQVAVGLRPLRRVQSGLAAIRSGHAQRLDDDYPPEIRALVDELNALLSHNEAIVERARTHAGNLAHALKTPLSVLVNDATATDTVPAETVRRQTAAMQAHVDHHLRRARATGSGLGHVTAIDKPLASLMRAMDKIYRDRGLDLEMDLDDDLKVAVTHQDLEEVIGNLLDNACKWATGRVRVSARRVAGGRRTMVRIRVADDGPGVPAAERETLFRRGRRLDESVPGTGLGLAIARDIAELNGGRVALGAADLGGLDAAVDLPAVD